MTYMLLLPNNNNNNNDIKSLLLRLRLKENEKRKVFQIISNSCRNN